MSSRPFDVWLFYARLDMPEPARLALPAEATGRPGRHKSVDTPGVTPWSIRQGRVARSLQPRTSCAADRLRAADRAVRPHSSHSDARRRTGAPFLCWQSFV